MAALPWDAPYDRLAGLPRSLWLPGLTCSAGLAGAAGVAEQGGAADGHGSGPHDPTAQRLSDLQRWQAALLQGRLPPADADFGDAPASAALRDAAARLGLAAACQGAGALTEQLLRTLLWHLDRLVDLQPRLSRGQAIRQVAQEFIDAWALLKADWATLQALLQGLGDGPSLRWDELRGQLSRREWAEAQRISETLKTLPDLVALIRRLGRAERVARPLALPPQPRETAKQQRLLGLKAVETRLPDAPGELRGIRQSDRIEGMLGSEAVMLLHPVLKKLWRARRAEARLLTYDSEAVLIDLRPDPSAPPRHDPVPPRPEALERGPILICLDTSGSMRGGPETLAKAVVLQALRTAHQERRGCRLIAFGGPDEIIERELSGPGGLAALLDLMGQGFDGGTDVQGPIERAIERLHQAGWASADLLIVSDGEFGCTPQTLARLDEARDLLGLRVQGVLVGDRETLGLMDVADDNFWVRDWRRHGNGPVKTGLSSPVHSKSLTALYFPGAPPAGLSGALPDGAVRRWPARSSRWIFFMRSHLPQRRPTWMAWPARLGIGTAVVVLLAPPTRAWDLAGTRQVVLHSRDGDRTLPGTVAFTPAADGRTAFVLTLAQAPFKHFFLSMKEFKCVESAPEVFRHVAYTPTRSPVW